MESLESPQDIVNPTDVVSSEALSSGRFSRCAKVVGRVAFVMGLNIMAVSTFGNSHVDTEHIHLELQSEIAPNFSGGITLDTPAGNASYATHEGPLGLTVTIDDIPIVPAIRLATGEHNGSSFSSTVEQEAKTVEAALLPQVLKTLAILGGVTTIGWGATSERSKRYTRKTVGASRLAGTIAAGIPVGIGAMTYDQDALSKPTYTGALAYGLENKDVLKILDTHDEDIAKQSGYLFKLLNAVESLNSNTEEPTTLRILNISDIHSRNVYALIKSMVDSYGISFIIDDGDIVDWGMPFENGFFLGGGGMSLRNNTTTIADLGVPYYYARGNHDDEDTTVAALRDIPNVIVLDKDKIHSQNGLLITGAGDPIFSPDEGLSKDLEHEKEGRLGTEVQQFLDQNPVDIAALHNPVAASEIHSGAVLIASGHRHKFGFKDADDSDTPIKLFAGTSGGAGLRMFDNNAGLETNQEFTIINYSADCRPTSLDRIVIVNSLSGRAESQSQHIPIRQSTPTDDSSRQCGAEK